MRCRRGEGAIEIFGRLKQLGVRLALDDFGTYSARLSSLKLLPFDRLKIDRSFVQDLQHGPSYRALARAIILQWDATRSGNRR